MNAPMIAREAGVSEATLTRFVYALGYEGFPEFLRDLRRCTLEAKNDNPFRQEVYRRKDRPVYKRVFELEKELLEETMNLLDTEMFELCVDRLAAADRIMLVGGPTHSYLAEYFANFYVAFQSTTQKPLVRRIFPFQRRGCHDGKINRTGIQFSTLSGRNAEDGGRDTKKDMLHLLQLLTVNFLRSSNAVLIIC